MRSRFSSSFGIASIAAIILITAATGLTLFLQHEKGREITSWRNTLDLTADARTRDISQWVGTQFRELTALSENASLQIYFAQLNASGETTADEQTSMPAAPPAQAQYLRSLLAVTAQRLAYETTAPSLSQRVGANVKSDRTGGLALLDNTGQVLVTTARMPALDGALGESIRKAPRGQNSFIDMTASPSGTPRVGFIVPVFGVQADRSPDNQIGSLVGIMPLTPTFYAMLKPDVSDMQTLEVALLRREGNSVRYLTPLIDKSPLMSRREEMNVDSAASFAVGAPNEFAEKVDYRNQPVLVTARPVENTPWTLIAKIDRAEAFGASAKWRSTVVAAVSLLAIALIATIIGIWRSASARQSARLANEAGARAELLSAVANHQPEPLYIVDGDLRLWFTNREAATLMQARPSDLRGKALGNAIGAAYAEALEPAVARTLAENTPQTVELQRGKAGAQRSIRAQLVPLDHIPVNGLQEGTPGVLVVEQDITDALNERNERTRTLQQLIEVIVARIDRRDPNAAEHSAMVAEVAGGTARSMGLDSASIETTELAARLMNLGKMDIPAEWLTRSGALKPDERDTIRSSLATSADLLEGIAFTGPVAETLRQAQEHVDGTGPMKYRGDQILVSARIIAAANALIGMMSARAWRPGMELGAALTILQEGSGSQFDRKVISALTNYLDNLGGAEQLAARTGKAAPRMVRKRS